MSLDGSGTYTPPAPEFPAISNTTILASDFNTIILNIAAAISTAIFRDGQAAFTANQSMGTFKLTNLGNGASPQDAVTFLQVFTAPSFSDPTLTGSLVTITATEVDASGVTTVTLPAGTAIGAVSATELGYLNGVTSAVQTQLDARVLVTSGTAADLTLTGVPVAPTAAVGTNTTQIATMAALIAQAFTAALPLQTGNAGKWVTTDGANASWAAITPPPAGAIIYTALNFGGF